MMEYKGYRGVVEFDDEADLFHGEIAMISDVVTFQGRSVDELKKAFHESVDDYLAYCEERGEAPDKPLSGSFLLRTTPANHRKFATVARIQKKSLNAWANEILMQAAGL